MKRFELYVWLATFFRSTEGQLESFPADRLWLLPWHVPPAPKSAWRFERGDRVQSVEQLIIAYKKLKEAARLLAAANERAAEEIKISSRIRWTGKAPPFPDNR
jgi:hypothetical protein